MSQYKTREKKPYLIYEEVLYHTSGPITIWVIENTETRQQIIAHRDKLAETCLKSKLSEGEKITLEEIESIKPILGNKQRLTPGQITPFVEEYNASLETLAEIERLLYNPSEESVEIVS